MGTIALTTIEECISEHCLAVLSSKLQKEISQIIPPYNDT